MPRLLIQAASSAALTWFFSVLLLRHRGSGAVIKEEIRDTQWSKEGTPVVGGIAFTLRPGHHPLRSPPHRPADLHPAGDDSHLLSHRLCRRPRQGTLGLIRWLALLTKLALQAVGAALVARSSRAHPIWIPLSPCRSARSSWALPTTHLRSSTSSTSSMRST